MRFFSTTVVAGAFVASAAAATKNYLGFNSGSTFTDRSAKFKADWEAEFTTAQNLKGAPGTFNAVRLYTNIQAYSTDTPIEAFEAAISTQTYILLGIWTSGTDSIANELSALTKAVKAYGSDFTDLVIGISIGSEDLYRNSATGIENKSGVGANPDVIVQFIQDYKKAVANTGLASVPVGHVDTWDVWPNTTNKAVLDAVDWIGIDEYPFYETGKGNSIDNAGTLFDKAYDTVVGVAGDKPVWVTETGWPTTGSDWDEAIPSVANAKTYWDEVGCRKLFNKTPTFWYNIRDSNPDNDVKFAITNNLSTTPYFNLTCPTSFDTDDSSSSSSSASASATSSSSSSSTATATKGSKGSTTTATKDSTTTGTATATGTQSGSATAESSAESTAAATASATSSGSSGSSSSDSSSGSSSSSASASAASASSSVVTVSAGRINAPAAFWAVSGLAVLAAAVAF